MKLLSREQIETLAKFKSEDYFTTSFFLDSSKNRMTKKEIQLSFKNLLNTGKIRLGGMSLPKAKKESIGKDLDKIKKYCIQHLPTYNDVGLSIFSCSGKNFWQVFNLVKSPRNMIVFDHNPYVRPLSAILDEYHRVCVLTLDRKRAKWYEIYMGEIFQLENMDGDVPSRTKEGGWEGYSSKRIERHLASRLREFFKKAAKKTFQLMEKNKFLWLFIGCKDEDYQILEPLLHPYLEQRLKSHIKAKPGDSPDKILKEALDLKNKYKKEEKENIVKSFINELEKGGLATSGIKKTLRKRALPA